MNINVSIDSIEIQKCGEKIHKGEYNINKCVFSFSKEYTKKLVSIAVFTTINGSYKRNILNNECDIPFEVLQEKGSVELGVYSYEIDEDGVLKLRYSPSSSKFYVETGSYRNAKESVTPSVSEFEKYVYIFNDNAIEKTKEFNLNADNRKKEIDALAKEVSKDKEEIIEIEKRVSASEQNAKASETNAKTSESNAQDSANKALESENNITAIQEEINFSKAHIDRQVESIEKSVENVEDLVEEATNQANFSKDQADISIENAGQVSADKTAVETMKNEVSTMKNSVEQTKADAEQIKTDTQGIYDNTVAIKEETLKAKAEVENSLENERNENDKKYARAIESDEIVIDGYGQVELDEDGYMKEFSAEANLPDITQKTRSGINLYNVKDVKRKNDEVTIDENDYITMTADNTGGNSTIYKNYCTKYSDRFEPNHEYFLVAEILEVEGSGRISFSSNHDSDKPQFVTSVYRDFNTLSAGQKIIASIYTGENNWMGLRSFATFFSGQSGSIKYRISILKYEPIEENFEYEPYGASPSLENPSEFENVVKNVKISNCGKNLINATKTYTSDGITCTLQEDKGIKVTGTANGIAVNVWFQGIYTSNFEKALENEIFRIRKGQTIAVKDCRIYLISFDRVSKKVVGVNLDNIDLVDKFTADKDFFCYAVRCPSAIEGKSYDLVLYPQVEIGDKATDSEPYKGYIENITLSENQFLGNFKGYKNYIKDNKLLKSLVKVKLNGTEDWELKNVKEKTQVFFWNLQKKIVPNIGFCNYLKFNAPGDVEKYTPVEGGIYIAINKSTASTVEELKNLLSSLYNSGNAMTFIYAIPTPEKEELSTEIKSKINSLKVYNGVNNIESSCKITFKANKNLKNELDKCVKNTDYATNNKSGLIKGRATHGFNIDSLGAPYLSTYDEEYKNLPDSSFVSTGTLKKVEDKILSTSNNTYTKALKDGVVDKDFAQIYADNPKIDNLAIKGEQLKQRVRQGYNLLKYPYVSTTKTQHGVSITDNGDGSITLNGTSTAKIDFGYQWTNNLPNDFYTFITYGLPDTCYTNYYQVGPKYGESVGNFNKTATTENINLGAQLVIPEGVTLDNITIYPMLVKGNYTRETIPAWEQYGASPSLDYPSEIEITREQDIQTNKNNFCKGYENTANSLKFFHALYVKGLKPSTTYTIAFKSNAIDNIYYINEYLTSTWLRFKLTGERQVFTFKTRDDITEAYIHTKDAYAMFKNSIDQPLPNEFEEVMLVEGTYTAETMPEYEPFEGEEYNVILPEGDFNNAIGEYSDKILADDKQKKFIKELVLTGEENWSIAYPTITSEEFQSYMLNVESFVNTWLTGKGIMSNCFLNVMGDIVFYKTERGICSDDKGHLVICTNILNIEEFKTKLKELHEAGTPVKIYYATEDPKIIDLPEGTVPKIELMDGLNNISIDKGIMSFEYNKSLARAFEEEREDRLLLQAQIDEIMTLLSSTSTASLLAENLAKDNESEVV